MAAPTVTDYVSITAADSGGLVGIGKYLPDLTGASFTAATSMLQTLAHMASRFIDQACGQPFYNEGPSSKFPHFVSAASEMQGGRQLSFSQPFFPSKIGTIAQANKGATSLSYTVLTGPAPVAGDTFTLDTGLNAEQVTPSIVTGTGPYTLTVPAIASAHAATTYAQSVVILRMAYFENQPLSQWLTVTGDGITPPSNFYLWPPNPRTYSAAGLSLYRPWWGIDLAHLPSPSTTFLPIYIGGYKTAMIDGCSWGWPAVPDQIQDMCAKMIVRAWKAKQAGEEAQGGGGSVGPINMKAHFDEKDLELLSASDFVAISL